MGERESLLEWYDRVARDLPWRRTRDAYAVWVSEIMLQQTRVETVVPYFERFMARFPTAAALARADEDDVLAAWSGLGYYRRARMLHAGVREVVARYGGRVPEDATERRSLPGIGRYTAGAIGSIAFDREEALVDGNVARVLARLRGIATPLGRADTDARLWAEAERLVQGARPGALNQALMELGATVCTPASPRCDVCPVARGCVARKTARVRELPVARPKKAPREVAMVAVLVVTPGEPERFWLVRGDEALFGGLWGLPMSEGSDRTAARAALTAAGIRTRLATEPVASVTHVLTHRKLTVTLWRGTTERARATPKRRLVQSSDLGDLGVSTLTRKLLAAAGGRRRAL